jgi:hypothetical protein
MKTGYFVAAFFAFVGLVLFGLGVALPNPPAAPPGAVGVTIPWGSLLTVLGSFFGGGSIFTTILQLLQKSSPAIDTIIKQLPINDLTKNVVKDSVDVGSIGLYSQLYKVSKVASEKSKLREAAKIQTDALFNEWFPVTAEPQS